MITLEELARQAGVEFVDGRTYFKKQYRNCNCIEKFNVAVQAHLDQDARDSEAHSKFVAKLEREKSALAKENSELAAQLAVAIDNLRKAEKVTIRRGLEAVPELSEIRRDRIMDVSGNGNS